MGGHKKKGSTFNPTVPTPIADYNVTGEIALDATCNYWLAGTYNDKPYYRRGDNAFFIWWHDPETVWVISLILGEYGGAGIWQRLDPNIVGEYSPVGAFSGNPVVAAGPH